MYTYVKHFICNDGESGVYRDSVYTWMTEQALREIYLKPLWSIHRKRMHSAISTTPSAMTT